MSVLERATNVDPSTVSPQASKRIGASGAELGLFALTLAGVVTALILLTGSAICFKIDFWMDEVHTLMLVQDPSVQHKSQALLEAVDNNLPGIHVVLGCLRHLGMPMDPVPLRFFALTCMWLGMVGVYAGLRISFGRYPCIAATLFLLGIKLVVFHYFDVRYYGLWFCATAWSCYFLIITRYRPRLWSNLLLALSCALVLSVHYFGLFSLGCSLLAECLADSRPLTVKLRQRWPVWLSMLTLAMYPVFYFAQRKIYTVPTWMDSVTVGDAAVTASFGWGSLLFLSVMVLLGIVWAIVHYWPPLAQVRQRLTRLAMHGDMRTMAPMLALLAYPILLQIFSLTIIPASLPRYNMPGLVGAAVVAAWVLARFSRQVVLALLALAMMRATWCFHNRALEAEDFQQYVDKIASIVQTSPPTDTVVFEFRRQLYPLVFHHPELRSRMALLDFEVQDVPPWAMFPSLRNREHERDTHRSVARNYPIFRSITFAELRSAGTALVICDDLKGHLKRLHAIFPDAQITPDGPMVFRLTFPKSSPTPTPVNGPK